MSTIHPLETVDSTSATSLVRMTLHHHSISVYHTKVEMNERVAVLGEQARSAAAENPIPHLVSDTSGVRTMRSRMVIGGAKGR